MPSGISVSPRHSLRLGVGVGVEHLGLEADWKLQLSLLVEKIPSQIQKILTKLLTWCQAREREL